MSGGKVRVLLVDDVDDQRVLVRVALETSGQWLVVAEASNGAQAVSQAEAHQPELVLLDLEMPWVDGIEALPYIRHAAPGAVVVAWTAHGDGVRARSALDLGAAAVVTKGYFQIGELGHHLAAILDEHGVELSRSA